VCVKFRLQCTKSILSDGPKRNSFRRLSCNNKLFNTTRNALQYLTDSDYAICACWTAHQLQVGRADVQNSADVISAVSEPAHLVAHQRMQHSIVVRPTAVRAISTDIIRQKIVQHCRTTDLKLKATCYVKLRLSLSLSLSLFKSRIKTHLFSIAVCWLLDSFRQRFCSRLTELRSSINLLLVLILLLLARFKHTVKFWNFTGHLWLVVSLVPCCPVLLLFKVTSFSCCLNEIKWKRKWLAVQSRVYNAGDHMSFIRILYISSSCNLISACVCTQGWCFNNDVRVYCSEEQHWKDSAQQFRRQIHLFFHYPRTWKNRRQTKPLPKVRT